jgi:hypothetical protein
MAKKETNILLTIKVKNSGKAKKHPNKKESVKKYKGQGR